jgi:hypothetical protein
MPKPEGADLLPSAEVVTEQLAGCAETGAGTEIPAGRLWKLNRRHPKRFIKFIKTDLYTGAGRCQAKNLGIIYLATWL